jgi:hypothetical protein
MSTLSTILQHLELALRLQASVPTLDVSEAYAHAAAATAAATEEVSAELLLGVAYVESRYNPTALSRVVDGVRKTGLYRSTRRPERDPGTSMFCGPLQTYARTWSECLAMRDLTTGYEAATRELQQWLRDRRVRGDITRALAGHACGNHGVNTGKCNRYPQRVLAKARRLRGAASRRAGS